MRSFRSLCMAALCVAPMLVSAQAADTPKKPTVDVNRTVPILQEPRHRTVHRDGDIYVLDIQINPGDMTLNHTHDAAILYNFISSGRGPAGGRISSNTEYVAKNFTHQVENEGPGLFRIIALTNYGPPIADPKADRPVGLTGEPEVENGWLRAYPVTIEPGKSIDVSAHANPNLIVQVGEGLVHVTREDGITSELTAMGHWAWRNARSPYQVRNAGKAPVKLVINEARRAQ